MTYPSVTLILPAYNEAATIRGTVGEAIDYFSRSRCSYEIVVAADGDDGTREIVGDMARENPRLHTIGGPRRLGKGRGVRLAVERANGEIIGYADADNKVPITEFEKVRGAFERGFDVVIGSRALAGSEIIRRQPRYRQIGSQAFAVALRTITGLRDVSDTQCGFKFFRRGAAKQIFEVQCIDGYMFDVEILALTQRFGYRWTEIPIRWRDDGDSRLELLRGNLRNARDLFRIRRSMRRLAAVGSRESARRAAGAD